MTREERKDLTFFKLMCKPHATAIIEVNRTAEELQSLIDFEAENPEIFIRSIELNCIGNDTDNVK